MLNRLLQAAAITCTVYLTMVYSQSPVQRTILPIDFQRPVVARLNICTSRWSIRYWSRCKEVRNWQQTLAASPLLSKPSIAPPAESGC